MNRSLTKRIVWKISFLAFITLVIFSSNSLYADTNTQSGYLQQNPIDVKQSITVQQELTIRELFKLIEKQTNFDFFYSSSLKELDDRVSLNLENKSVNLVLETAFINSGLEFTVKNNDVMIRKNQNETDQQQIKTVTGVVKDENGYTLPGTSVVIKGSTTGVTTDFDGNFEIEVAQGETLIFSFMGYSDAEIIVGASNSYNVSLDPSSNVLDEIIVSGVASGTSKKKMSVSVAKVNADALTLVPQTSVSSSLQGKVAGVTVNSNTGSPGSAASLTLRGATSLTGNQSPMILIDGVIMQGSLGDINVDDVESIEIVKGAAASALYGSRAGNGVVVITSKRGSRLNSGETTVVIRNEVGIQQVEHKIDVAKYHAFQVASDWQTVDSYTRYKGISYPKGYETGWDPNIRGNRRPLPSGYQTQPFRVNNDVQDALFENGLSYTNYIGVANRINQTNLFVSFENNRNQGVLRETGGYGRQSFRLNLDHAITDKIKISASNNFIMTNNDMPGGGNSAFASALFMDPDVDLLRDNDNGDPYNFIPNNWNEKVKNPLYDLWAKTSSYEKTRFLGSYELNWAIADWVSFKGSYSVESEDYNGTVVTPKGTYTFLSGGEIQESIGSISNYYKQRLNQNFRATLSFNHSWDIVDFNGKISYLAEDNYFRTASINGQGFDFADYPSFSVIPKENLNFGESRYADKAENIFAIASFVVKDRYIFDGLIRRDESSLFGADYRSNYYYRLSGAYRITEDFKIPGIQELKVRGAIGTAGQRPGFSYQYETYTIANGQYKKLNLGNTELKPSNSREIELGLDVAFLDRFTSEVTYSQTNTTDQFINVPLLAHQGGFQNQWLNAASLLTHTLEAMISANIVKTDKWNWDLTLTFDRTTSEITKLDIGEYQTGPQDAFFIREGESFGVMYGKTYVKSLNDMASQLPTGKTIADYEMNNEGYVIDAGTQGTNTEFPIFKQGADGKSELSVIGDMNPNFRMGINSMLSYKNFSFYMLWRLKSGGDIYNKTGQSMVRDNRNAIMDQVGKPDSEMKTISYYNTFYNGGEINEYWIEDGSYLRLSEASLSYRLNKNNLGSLGNYIKSINMSLIGKNIFTLTNYSGFDPEVLASGGYAYDNSIYPNFRTISFSLGLEF